MQAKILGVTRAQRHFREVIEEVVATNRPLVLTRDSEPAAVLISYDDFRKYEDLKDQREREIFSRFDRLLQRMAEGNEQFSDDEVAADVDLARLDVADRLRVSDSGGQ